MSDDTTQPSATPRAKAKILDALKRAERAVFTRPAPKSARAQMKFLLTRAKGSTKAVATGLGVSRSTVERYLSGASKKPQKRLQAALVEETGAQWQPQVRAQTRQRAATSGGLVISCRAYFGFTANGSSDEGRVKDIITAVSPSHAAQILQEMEAGATDEDLQPLLAEAITWSYFQEGGTTRKGLRADFTEVDWLEIKY
ncbi:telomere-protecting terminal protein Tpg [Streptomyces mirabilis]|uniref:telomere-protecting terminal protein Tpg n=1 Tax=Streptomyces mirabilis TaxID=68239 RepID=UPI0036CF6519